MDHRSAPPRELQLPSFVVPQRRRRTPRRSPRQATIPAAVRPPAALQAPSAPRQIPTLLAVAGAADADNLMLLAHTVVCQADAEAEAAFPPAGENLRSSPPLPSAAADEDKPFGRRPPLPPLAVDEPQSSLSMGRGHAATKASAGDCKKSACPQWNAGSSKGDQSRRGVASPTAASSPMQLEDDDEELELGEIPHEKPAAGCNTDPGHGSLLGKEEMVAVAVAVAAASECKAATTEMSAAEQKRMREVFVGGLSRDATQEDVRAALSAAGEITTVRMIRDRTMREKNRGYCFVAYRDAAMASKAVAELHNVKICGKPCRVAAAEGNEKANEIAEGHTFVEDYKHVYEQRQQLSPAVHSSYVTRWDDHHPSYVVPPAPAGYYIPMYHNGNVVYLPALGLNRGGLAGPSGRSQMGQSSSGRPAGQPHRSRK